MTIPTNRKKFLTICLWCVTSFFAATSVACSQASAQTAKADQKQSNSDVAAKKDSMTTGNFRWKVDAPFLSIESSKLPRSSDRWIAVKDPSVVWYDGQWHLFCTLRKDRKGDGRIRIGYLSFTEWASAENSTWSVLDLTPGYHGAPQIFFFEPHKKWYLIYQAEDASRGLKYGPCFSTNDDITKPQNWTLPQPLYVVPEGTRAGLDFWVICDQEKAHLFFTTLNGKMWRAETSLASFPSDGWSTPVVALQADIFEASHTYSVAGRNQFLTIVEAQGNRRRYFKGFVAERLDGKWTPLAASTDFSLVSPLNVINQSESWATSYSHGEFIRATHTQELLLAPDGMKLLFQGANDHDYRIKSYGQIPWKLGILSQVPTAAETSPDPQ